MQFFNCIFYIRFILKYDGPDAVGPLNDTILHLSGFNFKLISFIAHSLFIYLLNLSVI